MLIAGSILALLCGVANSVAAALEKHEGMQTGPGVDGLRLLAVLVRRSRWLLAISLSALAWVAEAAALALAPVAVVATLRSTGRGLLVVGGRRWLGERFATFELAAVVLATLGGVATALGASGGSVTRVPLSNFDELAVAAIVALGAAMGSTRRNGVTLGMSVGLLFVATGIFTKEIGDRVALDGVGAVMPIVASPGPWVMIAFSVWAQSLLQGAFRRANAASVAAANAAVSSSGLIVAGFALYHEAFPAGSWAVLLVAGLTTSVAGTVMLAAAGRVGQRAAD